MSLPAYSMNLANFPEMYEQGLVAPLFRPWAEVLVEESGIAPGQSLLDVACGTGIVARLAHARAGEGARAVGVDVSPQMLEVARRVAPAVDWRQGDAAALPVPDGERFDHVFCHQGLQFFGDKAAAVREMRRALGPGGTLTLGVWRALEEAPFFRDLHAIGERHLGPFVDQRHSFGDPQALEVLLRDAGFDDVRVRARSRTIRFENGALIVRLNTMALVGMSPAGKTMSEEDRVGVVGEIVRDSEDVLGPYRDGAGLTFELRSNVAAARA